MTEVSLNIGADSESNPPNTSSGESGNRGHKELRKANRHGTESGNGGHKELQGANSGGAGNQSTGNQTPIGHIQDPLVMETILICFRKNCLSFDGLSGFCHYGAPHQLVFQNVYSIQHW